MLLGTGGVTGYPGFLLFQMVFMDTAATIPTGAMAKRFKFAGFVLMGFWVSMIIYPLVGGWIWGGGWLQNLGRIAGLGQGAVDFAGSGVVHASEVGRSGRRYSDGPRIGRFNADGSPTSCRDTTYRWDLGHDHSLFGWFGFNPGSSLAFVGAGGQLASNAAVNTLIAGAFGGCSAMFFMWWFGPSKKPDPSMSVEGRARGPRRHNGALRLRTSSEPGSSASWPESWFASAFCPRKAQDRRSRRSRARPFPERLWGSSRSAFRLRQSVLRRLERHEGRPRALTAAAPPSSSPSYPRLRPSSCSSSASLVFFKVLNALKLLRSKPQDEIMGLDIPEMGALGYNNVDIRTHSGRMMPQAPFTGNGKNS